ncbi:helix-turn-helix domain-containing protein [Streptomyces sp. RM72]|uniref:helix-turn-helix domain-containing protein n=1 Tax=Streptomyces sp. RM72 TaxID=1115510 RepID=UPI001FFD15D0|nr:XRE family transcriptional regulator [Streptomyces sp. RM72]
MSGGDEETAQVMTSLGARLRAIRQARGLTLAQLAAVTGISVSTLSRLESGQREPGLRHLLPLARAHRLPLDELVGSRTGDPRVHPRPFTRHGQTWVPLTRNPNDGLHAYKQILPAPATPRTAWTPRPEQGSHEGHEWLYVLSGRLLLALGDHDLILTAGETAEFDTRIPHGIANAGDQPVEWIALYGAQGERMHIRVRPSPDQPVPGDRRADHTPGAGQEAPDRP